MLTACSTFMILTNWGKSLVLLAWYLLHPKMVILAPGYHVWADDRRKHKMKYQKENKEKQYEIYLEMKRKKQIYLEKKRKKQINLQEKE